MRFARFLLAVFLFMTVQTLMAQDVIKYEFVQPRKIYIGSWEENAQSYSTADEAMAQMLRLWDRREFKDAKIEVIGPEERGETFWYIRVMLSAYWIPLNQIFTEARYVTISYKCPTSGGWIKYYEKNLNIELCQRPVPPQSECDACNVKPNEPVPIAGNPIVLYSRIKRQAELDYTNVAGTLKFIRNYQSNSGKWTHNYDRYAIDYDRANPNAASSRDCFLDTQSEPAYCYPYWEVSNPNRLVLKRGNGARVRFDTAGQRISTEINDRAAPLLDTQGTVIGWRISNAVELSMEEYSLDGRLRSMTTQDGKVTKLEYSTSVTPKEIAPQSGLLLRVTDAFGAALVFKYNALGQMASMSDPEAGDFIYRYDDSGNLTSVTYPDGKNKTYLYNEAQYLGGSYGSHYLTGIVDENNARYATFTYLRDKAFSTEHAGGVGRYEISAAPYDFESVVKDPFGITWTYTFQQVGPSKTWRNSGLRKLSNTGSGTVVSSSISYDDQGNVSSKTDFDKTRTQFTYDLTRNLETKRVEATDTPYARTIATEWHPTFRLPAKIIEPLKVTKFKYDTTGNLLEKSVQATLDKTGAQGAAAALTGKIRTWKFTYNTVGQMLTSTNPDTAFTKFTYDSKGNLETVENALKQVTKYSNYDAHGRVGRIEDPNGLVQELTYTPRGWLETRTVKGRQWRYAYDGVGQLKQVDSPDGTFVSYTYDDAHRLVKVTDSLGNSITYTLDAMGNRKAEEVKDPSNTLVRKVSRTYDTLNQLKQQTGGAL